MYFSLEECLSEVGQKVLSDNRFGLAFLSRFPHPPAICNRQTHSPNWLSGTYLDNVALTDRVLDSCLSELAYSGQMDNTAVLVTADHGWAP